MVNFERDPHGCRAPALTFRMVCGGPQLTTELYQGEGNPRRFTCRLRLLQSSTAVALGYSSGRFHAVLLKGVPRDLQG